MRFSQFIVIPALLLCVSSGCSKLREMTRRDYSLLKDPFASSLADADGEPGEESPVDGIEASTAGFVKIGDTSADRPEAVVADYGTEANGATVSPGGNGAENRSQFRGITVRGMGNAISHETGPSLADMEKRDVVAGPSGGQREAGRTADMASMASFMREQAQASGLNETAEELTDDFTAYASQKEKQWHDDVAQVKGASTEAARAVRTTGSGIERVAAEVTESPVDVMDHLSDGSGSFEDFASREESAMPLIQNRGRQANDAKLPMTPQPAGEPPKLGGSFTPRPRRPLSRLADPVGPRRAPIGAPSPFSVEALPEKPQTPPTVTQQKPATTVPEPDFAEPPVFESDTTVETEVSAEESVNPFEAFATQSESKTTSPKAADSEAPRTLDSGFNFDSGWRPSAVVNPND